MKPRPSPHVWGVAEVCLFLGLSGHVVRAMIRRGDLAGCWKVRWYRPHPSGMILKREAWRIPDESLIAYRQEMARRELLKAARTKARTH